jgi:hypothetical protein
LRYRPLVKCFQTEGTIALMKTIARPGAYKLLINIKNTLAHLMHKWGSAAPSVSPPPPRVAAPNSYDNLAPPDAGLLFIYRFCRKTRDLLRI